MAFQFVHLQAYSRKGDGMGRSTSFVFNEARRDPAASIHVPTPALPVVIHGVSVNEAETMHDVAADAARTTPKGGKERKVRKDQNTLMTVIASHPYTVEEVHADCVKRGEVEHWERLTIEWLRHLYGDQLVSVVRHEDENHWHIHAYVLPDEPEMKASALHPGQSAKLAVMSAGPRGDEDSKAHNRRGDAAYKAAMRRWQDSYYEVVAVPCGLTRLGPARRRLTRAEWQAEQTQAKALRATLDRAKEVKVRGESYIAETKNVAAAIRAEAEAAKAEAERELAAANAARAAALKAQDKAVAEQQKARSMMARVRQEAARVQRAASRLQRLPGMLRGIWDGFRRSSVQDRIRADVSSEVDALREQVQSEAQRARAANEAHKRADVRFKNLRDSLRDTVRELDDARQELSALRPAEPETTPASTFDRL